MDTNNKPTVEQLKARAYDLLAMKQQIDNELGAINQAIAEQSQVNKEQTANITEKENDTKTT